MLTQINNDTNGNPRYVCHFLEVINDSDKHPDCTISEMYEIALKKSRKYGGKRYHNRQYGGGNVFASYSRHEVESQILKLKNQTS
jgi:hypothetical protein